MKKPFLRLPGLLSIAVLFLFTMCKKEDPLPAATQEGANTFGCKVNGAAWIPNGGPGFMGAEPIEGGFKAIYDKFNQRSVGIYLRAHKRSGELIHLYCNDYRVGKYDLNQETNIRPFTLYPRNYGMYAPQEGNYFVTNSISFGSLTISKSDTITGILSGTFEFRAENSNKKESAEISNGRFDINVLTLR